MRATRVREARIGSVHHEELAASAAPQLTILRPQPEVDCLALSPDLYMFPRQDGIVLGGAFEHHVSSLEPDLAAEDRVMAGHAKFFASLG